MYFDFSEIKHQRYTNQKFSAGQDLLDRTNDLDIDVPLKVSFMGGLIEVSGSAKYLNTMEDKSDEVSVSFTYQGQRYVKALVEHQLPDAAHTYVCDLSMYEEDDKPTHVVTSLYVGLAANIR